MTVIHVFPGQGSHRTGMGQELFSRYPHLIRQADAVLGYSIEELCLSGPSEQLAETRYTQCAVYVVDALAYVDRVRTEGVIPDFVAGHSLGEYAALFAAGAFDFATGLELVAARAALMTDAGSGAMVAVIGLGVDTLREILRRHGATSIDIANLNSPEQTVIAGPKDDVRAVGSVLAETAKAVVPLNVSGAFHSRYMAPAAEEFDKLLRRYRFASLRIPVISNVSAAPYRDGEITDLLRRQLTEPVRWTESIEYLLAQPSPEFHEVGPGQVLFGLIGQIRPASGPRPQSPVSDVALSQVKDPGDTT